MSRHAVWPPFTPEQLRGMGLVLHVLAVLKLVAAGVVALAFPTSAGLVVALVVAAVAVATALVAVRLRR
jgi:hypothetical protein